MTLRITTRPACGLKPQASSPSAQKIHPFAVGSCPYGLQSGLFKSVPVFKSPGNCLLIWKCLLLIATTFRSWINEHFLSALAKTFFHSRRVDLLVESGRFVYCDCFFILEISCLVATMSRIILIRINIYDIKRKVLNWKFNSKERSIEILIFINDKTIEDLSNIL